MLENHCTNWNAMIPNRMVSHHPVIMFAVDWNIWCIQVIFRQNKTISKMDNPWGECFVFILLLAVQQSAWGTDDSLDNNILGSKLSENFNMTHDLSGLICSLLTELTSSWKEEQHCRITSGRMFLKGFKLCDSIKLQLKNNMIYCRLMSMNK